MHHHIPSPKSPDQRYSKTELAPLGIDPKLQCVYDQTPVFGHKRPKNLRDILVHSKLTYPPISMVKKKLEGHPLIIKLLLSLWLLYKNYINYYK